GARAGADRSPSQPAPTNVLVHTEGKEKPRAHPLPPHTRERRGAAGGPPARRQHGDRPGDGVRPAVGRHVRVAGAREDIRQERLLVRGGSGLDEWNLRERTAAGRSRDAHGGRPDPRRDHDRGTRAVRIESGGATPVGRSGTGSEDAYLLEPPMYAVADGMGGHRGGEVASQLALTTIAES